MAITHDSFDLTMEVPSLWAWDLTIQGPSRVLAQPLLKHIRLASGWYLLECFLNITDVYLKILQMSKYGPHAQKFVYSLEIYLEFTVYWNSN